MPEVSVPAVIAAAGMTFLLGGLWYSPALFGKAWLRAAGVEKHSGHPLRVFGASFLFSLLAAFTFAALLGPAPSIARGVGYGLLVGACVVAASFGINYAFANRGPVLWLVDGGYHTVQFALFGLVLGAWS
jgi:hypothetical protein